MRLCKRCNKKKVEDQFYSTKTPQWCRACWRVYRQGRRVSINIQDRARRKELSSKVISFLSDKTCIDCGEGDIVVLQFDHCRGIKFMDIAAMVAQLYSWARIQDEIKKCDIVCANCHFRRTAKRSKSARYMFVRPD